jgi:hypothetical protein
MAFCTSKWLVEAGRMATVLIALAGWLHGQPAFAQAGTDAKTTCERYVAALAGKQADPTVLHDHEMQWVAQLAPELTTCGAVARDSDDACNLLQDLDRNACRDTRATYAVLRQPEKPVSILGDVQFENCRANKELAESCEALRTATRTGNAAKCPKGNLGVYCRAAIALDPSLCRFTGPNPEGQQRDCQETIKKLKVLAPGLQELAKSGPPPHRYFAKAALGEADACAPLEQKVTDACIDKLKEPTKAPTPPPVASTPNPPAPAPAATPQSN